MNITQGKTVTIAYSLRLEDGEVLDSNANQDPLTYIQGEDQLLFGIEEKLAGKQAGDELHFTIPPEDGYGTVMADALIEIPLEQLPVDGRQVGAQITAEGPEGLTLEGAVTTVGEQTATVDFNHPLAGKVLLFDVIILNVEDTPEETEPPAA